MLYLGRLHPKKNLYSLFRAWSLVHSRLRDAPTWRLVIAGWDQDGHEAFLRSIAKDLRLDREIVFAGPLYGRAKNAAFYNATRFSSSHPSVKVYRWQYWRLGPMAFRC